MTKQLTPLRRKDIDTGARLERVRIVAWLRGDKDPYPDAHDIADEIEAGKHLE